MEGRCICHAEWDPVASTGENVVIGSPISTCQATATSLAATASVTNLNVKCFPLFFLEIYAVVGKAMARSYSGLPSNAHKAGSR
jgi:hypothetical protein